MKQLPKYSDLFMTLLLALKDGSEKTVQEITHSVVSALDLDEEQLEKRLGSGTQRLIDNRIGWARTYLSKAGLIERISRGVYKISDQGSRKIQENRTEITLSDLEESPDFKEWRSGDNAQNLLVSTDKTIEDPTAFALERHLEDFLVHNWAQTPLAANYKIFQDEENTGRQFKTDTGFIDILAISRDRKELLVVELKKGRASDAVVGQIQRYMGFIAEVIAEEHQRVRGIIIALEDDLRIRRALNVAPNIEFYRYEVKFDLIKT